MAAVKRLVLKNFKKFKSFEVELDPDINIFVGSNEAGKSTILQALDILFSVSRSKIETIGLEALFNTSSVEEFMVGDRKFADLPELVIEAYLEGVDQKFHLDGRNNSKKSDFYGVKLECRPIDEYSEIVESILNNGCSAFPFEYYGIRFLTFADDNILPYKKPFKHILIDSSLINNEYATREYTRSMYVSNVPPLQRNLYSINYRNAKSAFKEKEFGEINRSLKGCKFDIATNPKSNIETDIIITEDDIPITSKGKGRQCFIKTEFALKSRPETLDAILIEEPENHLSHAHMNKLVDQIRSSTKKQLFIATHSSFIATRLNLRKVIVISDGAKNSVMRLNGLSKNTSDFFMKAPDNNLLELAICKKALLIEGDAEFILMESFYKTSTQGGSAIEDGVYILSIDGTSFKRYFELVKLLGTKVAAIRDNDGDYQKNCIDRYSEFISDKIKVFADKDDSRRTFETCVYNDNKKTCDDLFAGDRKTLTVEEYMLKNKTESAFNLLEKKGETLIAPQYIKEAIEWIRG